jgi:hypothetical protein
MRNQLHEIENIDNYLLNKLGDPDKFLFETKLIIDRELKINMFFQRRAHYVIRWFGRNEKKKQLHSIFNRVMNNKEFSAEINSIFS